MAKSDARFQYRASLSRTDHELSRPFGFTCAAGQLLPIHADLLTAGDSVYVKHDLPFMRSLPLAQPAMIDVKIHFETFFVPLQMIYQPAEQTLFSLKNGQSSNYVLANYMNNNFPLFDYAGFITDIKTNHATDDYHAQAFRLADMLGLEAENFCTWPSGSQTRQPWIEYQPSFFPWQILAYHTIYQYFYRLDDKSQFDNSFANWDKYYATSTPIKPAVQFMQIHQRPWNMDYFLSMYRSPIVSDANAQRVMPSSIYNDLGFASNTIGITSTGNEVGGSGNNADIRAFTDNNSSTYSQIVTRIGQSTAIIRQMFANEKLAMITGRTRKNYDSQVLAHFGVDVPHDVKHDLTLIGHDEYVLKVGEVTSLASTSDAPLGELAGKGWASSRDGQEHKQHKFTAPVHGVIMTIFSVEPLKRYYGGFERQNVVTNAYDLPTPEFDRLGNMPMYRFESGGDTGSNSDAATDIIGWKERYYQWKRRSPRVTMAFANGQRGQGVNNYTPYMLATRPFAESGNSQTLAPLGTNSYYCKPNLESRFYIPAHACDNVMILNYVYGFTSTDDENWNINPWQLYMRDPFIVDCHPIVKKVSWMSKDGEPVYPY
jgi:hypothetical protein